MKVAIIGANGKVGRIIAQKMGDATGFEPTAIIRKEEQKAYFDSIDVPAIVESVENSEEYISKAVAGFDAVVFTAGSGAKTGYDKTMEVDLYGAIKTINASEIEEVKRFVMVSASFSDEPTRWPSAMRPYYIAKHLADKELTRSSLDYTILRPVRLTDEEEEGKIKIETDPYQLNKEIPRSAVAETVLQVLPEKSTHGKIMAMSEGEDEINQAIDRFIAQH